MPAGVEVTRELDEQVLREVRVGVFVSDGEHGLTAGAAAAERLELRDRGQHPELESARLQPSRSGSLGARSYSATCSTDGATYADSVVIVPAAGSTAWITGFARVVRQIVTYYGRQCGEWLPSRHPTRRHAPSQGLDMTNAALSIDQPIDP